MNNEDIIGIARSFEWAADVTSKWDEFFISFAAVIAADEREACAKLLENTDLSGLNGDPKLQHWIATLLSSYAAAIRARDES